MNKLVAYAMVGFVLLFAAMPSKAAVEIGKPAPEIEATDINGNPFKLSDHKGEIVVLEWTNHECPFVKKHYDSGNMQKVQKEVNNQGVKWVSIVSSAEGNQGYTDAVEAKKILQDADGIVTAKILDPSGEIGKIYDAKTTPHMFIINTDGNVVYKGAIDDNSSANPATIEGAENYVLSAISDIKAGNPVKTAQTKPYGCSVKY